MENFGRPIRVFVVAPLIFSWGFEKLVHTASLEIRLTGTATTLVEAMPRLGAARVDVAVVDLEEATAAEREVAQAAQSCRVLLLTSRRDAGAQERRWEGVTIVRKDDPPSVLLTAVEHACQLDRARPGTPADGAAASSPDEARIASLTLRERQLVFAVTCHATEPGKVIARRLCISERTLRNHLTSIYTKLGIRSRLGLHAYAARHNLDLQGARTLRPESDNAPPPIT